MLLLPSYSSAMEYDQEKDDHELSWYDLLDQCKILGNCMPICLLPNSTLTLTSHLEQNEGIGEGVDGQF